MSQGLIEVEQALMEPDAIMEPDILNTLKKYVAAGGKPLTAVELISENYRGLGQMASLVSSWVDKTADTRDTHASDGGELARTQSVSSTILSASKSEATNKRRKIDEVHFVSELIKERFEPKRADSCVSDGGFPRWLPQLLEATNGRHLLYDLADVHSDCLVLKWAITTIWKQGHSAEVAASSTAASYFGVLCGLLAERLHKLLSSSDLSLQTEVVQQVCRTSCRTQEAFLFTQLMLSRLAQHPQGRPLRRLMQTLEMAAREQQGSMVVGRMVALYGAPGTDTEGQAAFSDLLLNPSAPPSSSDIQRLVALYSSHSPPPIAHLHHPLLINKLLAELFAARKEEADEVEDVRGAALEAWRRDPDYRRHLVDLLALGAAARAAEQRASAPVRRARTALHAALAAIDRAHAQGGGGGAAGALELEAPQVQHLLAVPIAAAGLLHWLREELQESLRLSMLGLGHARAARAHIRTIRTIALRHPLLQERVLAVLLSTLHILGNKESEEGEALIEIAVLLLMHGHVEAVLEFAGCWTATCQPDPSMVRSFVAQVLVRVGHPYSRLFVDAMLSLIAIAGTKDYTGGHARLHEFAESALHAEYDPPLPSDSRHLLQTVLTHTT